MSTAREEILAALRDKERGGATPPAPWRSRQQFGDLAARFTATLTGLHGEVIRAASAEEALDRLGDVLRDLGAARVVANDEPPLAGVDLAARWPGIAWHVVGRTEGDLRAFCAGADAGITGADAALAETGSVIVSSGPGRSRMASLLPPVHIALIAAGCLTSDILTWAAARSGDLPASVTAISGPSKTADIEQTLAIGMHGPKRVIAILYGEPGETT
ncbi:MAG: lactate utilization protein [Anaerolineae bacterium]|nr:lactate utilization protein [Anaerolineae bacterium]